MSNSPARRTRPRCQFDRNKLGYSTIANVEPITDGVVRRSERQPLRTGPSRRSYGDFSSSDHFRRVAAIALFWTAGWAVLAGTEAGAAGGDFNLTVIDEATGRPTIARVEITRQTSAETPLVRRRVNLPRRMPKTVTTGRGFVIDGDVDLVLPDGSYQFRITRGLEYRLLTGHFSIERTSQDARRLMLPKILDLRKHGWTSGDCLLDQSGATAAVDSLPMRMAAADLNFIAVCPPGPGKRSEAGRAVEKPVPGRTLPKRLGAPDQRTVDSAGAEGPDAARPPDWTHLPLWIDPRVRAGGGLAFYGAGDDAFTQAFVDADGETFDRPGTEDAAQDAANSYSETWRATERLMAVGHRAAAAAEAAPIRVAVTDPFAWPLPVWLASGRVAGFFVLGDWLRLDRQVMSRPAGRAIDRAPGRSPMTLGREAEQIYWHLLDCGLPIVPLAGTVDQADTTPLGYNRLYVAGLVEERAGPEEGRRGYGRGPAPAAAVRSADQWWRAAWAGRSVATNGPLLRPTLQGYLPGHTFELEPGQTLSLTPELQLTVQDPVDYLEVIVNGRVHQSARLDEFAAAGGRLSPLVVDRPGWALIRVVTEYPDHFRAATSAPWFFTVGGRRRVSARSVEFFQQWLSEYEDRLKTLPPKKLERHVPLVRAARVFWKRLAQQAATTDGPGDENRGN